MVKTTTIIGLTFNCTNPYKLLENLKNKEKNVAKVLKHPAIII